MPTTAQTRSLYRSFWRGLARVTHSHRSERLNLRRLYRAQLREALADAQCTVEELEDQADRTLSLLAASPRLAFNLASLTYHHTPTHIHGVRSSARLAHLAKPIAWDPKDPTAVRRAWDKREKDQLRDPAWRISHGVDVGLRRIWRETEDAAGGVWLGRIPLAKRGTAG